MTMSEPIEGLSPQDQEYYRSTISAHKTSGSIEQAKNLAKVLGISIPDQISEETVSNPDRTLDWAKTIMNLEENYASQAGLELDELIVSKPADILSKVSIDPTDSEKAKMAFMHMYTRASFEAFAALQDDVTPERISYIRGGGKLFEKWIAGKMFHEPSSQDPNSLNSWIKELKAIKLVANPIDGLVAAGTLVSFIKTVESFK